MPTETQAAHPESLLVNDSEDKQARTAVTVAYGDGIGPEIMEATLRILDAAGAKLDIEQIEIGESVYRQGVSSGIAPESWESLRRTKVFLKAPITTPQGSGFKSLNVTIRKALGLYANVRPCVAYAPFIHTRHPHMDVVIIRENEEDLYAGIEHRQTDEVMQCLKLITRPGCERIVRYAFEYAQQQYRKKVTCFSKDNIMKLTDGLFHRVFDEIATDYPQIESEHMIVDIGAARLADTPEMFDVLVMPNLYGDIVSDVAAQLAGSVGFAPSANIGEHGAMFEAIHGSAPQIAGQNKANPSGLLLSAVLMLNHIGQPIHAQIVHNAWLRTVEDGVHTFDMFTETSSTRQVGTKAFTAAVIERIGDRPRLLKTASYPQYSNRKPFSISVPVYRRPSPTKKEQVGVDLFLHWSDGEVAELGSRLSELAGADFTLQMITNRGVKVWPGGLPETFCTDHWRCRFIAVHGHTTYDRILQLMMRISDSGLDIIKSENLCMFDGQPGYSLGQGQ